MSLERYSVTRQELRDNVSYNIVTGEFTRRSTGHAITSTTPKGYIHFKVQGEHIYGHRAAFLYLGEPLPVQVDHINRNRSENMWCNLRASNNTLNNSNRKYNNTFIGVGWDTSRGKWLVSKRSHGNLGRFTTHYAACYKRHVYNLNIENT